MNSSTKIRGTVAYFGESEKETLVKSLKDGEFMENITAKYVNRIHAIKFADLSEHTLKDIKKVFIDAVGCMLAGVNSEIGKATLKVFDGFGGVSESSVLGTGKKFPAAIAAYINAETCVGPDLSDNYQPESIIISHPGEAVIPAVLALAEKRETTLDKFYTAVVAGYETAGRYAKAIEPRRPEAYGFSPHYTLAAAAGCGKLLDFSCVQMQKNLGIAGALAPLSSTLSMWGFRKRPASWHRDMPGHANFSAVIASAFAQTDFEASHGIFDTETDFFKMTGSENYDTKQLFEKWGNPYVIEEITFKQVPS